MTKEERAEKKRLLAIEKQRMEAEFPGAVLCFERGVDLSFTQIRIEDGDKTWLALRKSKSAKWDEEHDFPQCERISVNLGANIPALAQLIRALVVRYNAIVKDTNAEALQIPRMEPFAIIAVESSSPHP